MQRGRRGGTPRLAKQKSLMDLVGGGDSSQAGYKIIHQMEEQVSLQQAESLAAKAALERAVAAADKLQLPAPANEELLKQELMMQVHKELFRLFMSEGDQQERLEVVGRKRDEMETGHKNTKSRVAAIKEHIAALEGESGNAELKAQQTQEAQEEVAKLFDQLDDLEKLYNTGKEHLEEQLKAWKTEVRQLEKDIHYMEAAVSGEPQAPGPYFLRFVTSQWWFVVSSLVILCNLICIFHSIFDGGSSSNWLENIFLGFYTFELACSLIFYQHTFFQGSWSTKVGWHVLDVFIVLASLCGVILPAVVSHGSANHTVMRLLMWFRLARVLKIVNVSLKIDLSWVEGTTFHVCMMCVIGVNCLTMGIEMETQEWGLWTYFNSVFTVIYLLELLVRIRYHGRGFFCEPNTKELFWNYLDLTIVALSALCLWILPILNRLLSGLFGAGVHMSRLVSVLRVARLMRILRFAELIKSIPPLYVLVVGIAKALQGMGWVILLAGAVLYFCALIGVKFVGQGWLLPHMDEDQLKEVQGTFGDISAGVFNLFKAMNGDLSGVDPLIEAVASSKYFMMLFMVITNWGIFSILTAVVSDNMAMVTTQHEQDEVKVKEKLQEQEKSEKLEAMFASLDVDGNGCVDLAEFRSLLNDSESAEELSKTTGLPMDDLDDLFDLLSKKHGVDRVDTITHDEFMRLLSTECGQVKARSMMQLEKSMAEIEASLLRFGLEPSPITSSYHGDTRMARQNYQKAVTATESEVK